MYVPIGSLIIRYKIVLNYAILVIISNGYTIIYEYNPPVYCNNKGLDNWSQ